MDSLTTAQRRHAERMERIDRALRKASREAGCTVGALRCLWYYADPTSQYLVRMGDFMNWRRVTNPCGATAAARAGLIGDSQDEWLPVTRAWSAPITPAGRRALWRLHERLAEVVHG